MKLTRYIVFLLVSAFLPGLPSAAKAQFGMGMGVRGKAVLKRSPEEIQKSLIWLDLYSGTVDGVLGRGSIAAVRKFQALYEHEKTGKLTDKQYSDLVERASRVRSSYGWAIFEHPSLGYRIGYPASEMQEVEPHKNGGHRLSSKNRDLVLEIDITEGDELALNRLYKRLVQNTEERSVRYNRRKSNWLVVSGTFRESTFYTRVENRGASLIGYTFRWPQARDGEFERVAVAMANSFFVPKTFTMPKEVQPASPIASEDLMAPGIGQHEKWIRTCTDASIAVSRLDLTIFTVELGSNGDKVIRCLLSSRNTSSDSQASDSQAVVAYPSPFDKVVEYEDGPTPQMLEVLLRTDKKALIVSGANSDSGVTRAIHVSGNVFIVQTGYTTHQRAYLIFGDSGEASYLTNGHVEVADGEKLIFLVEMRKSYFNVGGAFWFDAKIDRDGNILDIVTPAGRDFLTCVSRDQLSRKSNLDLSRVARREVCLMGYLPGQ